MNRQSHKKPLFPVSRLKTTYDFHYFAAYGNTVAEDLLECVRSNVKDPSILLLGCGDLRSVFYSIWKNFDQVNMGDRELESFRFTRVKFVMNDLCVGILARDILLLYLCTLRPKEESGKSVLKWLGAVWSIWYCHELLSRHEHLLSSALSSLVGFGAGMRAWSSTDNPLSSFVQFTSKYILRDVCEVWKMWKGSTFGDKTVDMMKADRLHEKKRTSLYSYYREPLEEYFGEVLSKTKLFTERKEAMMSEVEAYLESGSAFAENVFDNSFSSTSRKTTVNTTFYERQDGKYSFYYNSVPYRSFHHSFQLSPSQLLANGVPQKVADSLPVPDASFEKYPLLANSVQQLALWLHSCASILALCSSSEQPCLSFTFHCSDAVQFCRELHSPYHSSKFTGVDHLFDVVHTSTLCEIDCISNLVLYTTPLLKPDGLLYTGTLKSVGVARTTKAYIGHSMGCNTKLLPVILGIRVLNYDSSTYSSILPPTPEQRKLHGEYTLTKRNIIWKREVLRHAYKLPHLGSSSNLGDSLSASLMTSVGPQDTAGPLATSATGIRTLLTFVAQAGIDQNNFDYWFRLCELIAVVPLVPRLGVNVKRFLPDLQMQAYLHHLHIHFAVKEISCPICRGLLLYEFLAQYIIDTELDLRDERLGVIVAYIHDEPLNLSDEQSTFHGVSTIALTRANKGSKRVQLAFYAPVAFAQNGYSVTLITSNGDRPVFSGKLESYRIRGVYSHSFDAPLTPVPQHTPTSFGSLKTHLGNGHIFNSEINLTDEALAVLAETKELKPRKVSLDEIELACGEHKIRISYPYPIDFDSLSLKISKKDKTVTIEAKRVAYNFDDELPLYLSNPNNPFTLPLLDFDSQVVAEFCKNQYNPEDLSVSSSPDAPPLVKVKNIISTLIQESKSYFFTYSEPGGSNALIVVNNRVFDYPRKSPAVDISFCFASNESPVIPIWSTMVVSPVMTDISPDVYQLLKRVVTYYFKRTAPSVLSTPLADRNKRLDLLAHWKLDPCFERAVVYPIYYEPDPEVKGLPTIDDLAASILEDCDAETKESYRKLKTVKDLDLHEGYARLKQRERESKCSYCEKTSENLRKCTRCQSVQYCNKECQQKHWPLHKASCKEGGKKEPVVTSRPPIGKVSRSKLGIKLTEGTQCHYCSKFLKVVRWCGGCRKVSYCNKFCQEEHWKYIHKYECLAATLGKAPEMTTSFPEYSAFSSNDPAWREVAMQGIGKKCSHCSGTASGKMKECHCGTACYCGPECRRKDWEKHRASCKCNKCGSTSESMMMCPCFEAAYCGRVCQKLDWSNHKALCPLKKK